MAIRAHEHVERESFLLILVLVIALAHWTHCLIGHNCALVGEIIMDFCLDADYLQAIDENTFI